MRPRASLRIVVCLLLSLHFAQASANAQRGDTMIEEYFRDQTRQIQSRCLEGVTSLEEWKQQQAAYREQLMEMLGLSPLPAKTDLQATVTGTTEHDAFTVQRLHFQSLPGLYVTANLYLPKNTKAPCPAVLYVCGHGAVKEHGVSYGNKVAYHHHGCWFARAGYACLTIDSLQLGEIEGIHHGTYRYNMWWWLNRGYTPAGVEAWNCIRALDFLQSLPQVDASRMGVTGRSGGGAYSWFIAAIDERIQCAVPVAGITDLQNHVVDGCVEGHCDCMYFFNTYQWDYPMLAALVAPRPLLISNTDRDRLFPLSGVARVYEKSRRIYELYGAADKIGLHITSGPHKDTQELRIHAFRWLNKHLQRDTSLIEHAARPCFEPEELKVFDKLPVQQINTTIQESFVSAAKAPPLPENEEQLQTQIATWKQQLLQKTFAGWPAAESLQITEAFSVARQGIRFRAVDFTSQEPFQLRLYVAHQDGLPAPDLVVLNVLDGQGWSEFLAGMGCAFETEFKGIALPDANEDAFAQLRGMFQSTRWAMAYVAPRGVGLTAWNPSERNQTQIRRRFYLLGQTLDGMRVYDTRRAIQALRQIEGLQETPVWLQSERAMGGVALYASLFEPDITRLDLYQLPASHREGPYLLNVNRVLDVPQALAWAASRSRVVIFDNDPERYSYVNQMKKQLGWDKSSFQVRPIP